METTNRTFYEIVSKSAHAEIDELPFMTRPNTVLMIVLLYLVFVLKIGPAYMKNRAPFELKTTILIYNFIQVALSAYLVHRAIYGLYVYFAAKVSELLDTVFFVLRKKDSQVSFLHVYHHSCMVLSTWSVLKYGTSHIYAYICFINSLVHVFMYAYYGLSGLGPTVVKYLWWKKYLTRFQIIQFASMLLYYSLAVSLSDCPPPKGFVTLVMFNTSLMLVLFTKFYKESYLNIKKRIE